MFLHTSAIMLSFIFEKVMMWVMSTYYGLAVLFGLLKDVYRLGFSKVFHWDQFSRPACLDDPSLGTHGILHIDEVKIHYVASGPEDKPLMLFLHGFPEFWYSWRYQMREFQKDYRVVAIDMRGYGGSDKPSGVAAYSIHKLTKDVKEVILALGYKSCILVAHDWGGAIAWKFALQYSDMVDKLICMNCPPIPIYKKASVVNKEQRSMSWYFIFFQLPWLPEFSCKWKNYEFFNVIFGLEGTSRLKFSDAFQKPLSQEDLDAYKYAFSQPGALSPPINYYRALVRDSLLAMNDGMNYTMPALLIWGCNDYCLSITAPDIIEKEYPKITVKRIPESGHFVQMDTPDKVNTYMREWLAEQGTD